MSESLVAIVSRLTAIYGDPRTSDPEQFIKEFCGALTGYRIADIHRAIDRGRKIWKFFPKASEVIEILSPKVVERTPNHPVLPPRKAPTEQQRAAVKNMVSKLLTDLKSNGRLSVESQAREREAFQRVQSAPGEAIRASRGKMAAAGDTNS